MDDAVEYVVRARCSDGLAFVARHGEAPREQLGTLSRAATLGLAASCSCFMQRPMVGKGYRLKGRAQTHTVFASKLAPTAMLSLAVGEIARQSATDAQRQAACFDAPGAQCFTQLFCR